MGPKVTYRQSVMNVIAGGLGTGMFSLPWSMAGASVLPGLLLTVLVVALNLGTIMILVLAAERHQVFDLGNVLALLPGRLGPAMQAFSNTMVWLAMIGCLISYIIVMHDSALIFVRGTFLAEQRWPLVTLSSLVVLPICFFDLRRLSWTSSTAFLVNVYLFLLLCVYYGQHSARDELPTDCCLLGVGTGSLAMTSALMQCIIIQMCVLPMYEELENRSPRRFLSVMVTGFTTLGVIFGAFATVGYLLFGPKVESNALLNLPHNGWSAAARLGTIVVVAAVYPIMVIPMLAPVKNMSSSRFARPDMPPSAVEARRRVIVTATTCGIVAISFGGALCIKELGIINVIDGAACVAVFTALGPGLVGLYLIENRSQCWRIAMWLLVIGGIVLGLLGLYFNDNYRKDLAGEACLWRSGQLGGGYVLTATADAGFLQ